MDNSSKDKKEEESEVGNVQADTDSKPAAGYEYLDHTADIQVHAWGPSLKVSLEQSVLAMFGYMTELGGVSIDESATCEFEVEGHDLLTLLYNLLDEFLFRFSADDFLVCKEVEILELSQEKDGSCRLKVRGRGEEFDLAKHEQGTEVKAITYSNMQIHCETPTNDIYVILDI